jgi:hypothetical protein
MARLRSHRQEYRDMRQNLVIVLFGLAAIALGVYEFYDLMALEAQGGTRRVHSVIKLIYETAGKYGVLGIFAGVGAIMVVFGAVRMIRKPRDQQTA